MAPGSPQGLTQHATSLQVFEKLGASLYDYLRRNHYEAFELPLVRAYSRQLLEATLYLHDLSIIHTDLKPENILVSVCDPEPEPSGDRYGRPARAFSQQVALLEKCAAETSVNLAACSACRHSCLLR